ncbi:MAG TPA: FtsW/RodA/SpoVE family cell cycle protein [Telluria sp.]|nr:FtsW/RodA/SpoVE family cell cycle protein [Telluria sp.]
MRTALVLLFALQLLALLHAPDAWYPEQIEVNLKPGQRIVLGGGALAAPQADGMQVEIQRNASGSWFVRSLAGSAPLAVAAPGRQQRSGTMLLAPQASFVLGAARFVVAQADEDSASLNAGGTHWRYDGATLYRDGTPQPACPDDRFVTRAIALWNRLLPAALTVPRPLAMGGNLHCGNRIGIAHVEPGSATLKRIRAGIQLASAPGVALELDQPGRLLAAQPLALAGAEALVVGTTRERLRIEGDALRLTPSGHVALFPAARAELPPGVDWTWRQRAQWAAPPAWWLVLAATALGTMLLRRDSLHTQAPKPSGWYAAGVPGRGGSSRASGWLDRLRSLMTACSETAARAVRAAPLAAAGLLCAGVAAIALQRWGQPFGIGASALLAALALGAAMHGFGRVRLAMAAGLLLLAIGLLAQLEQALGAQDLGWQRHFQRAAALLAIGIGAGILALRWLRARPPLSLIACEGILLALAAAALLALGLQVLFGDETGVFDLQPVEFAKLALTALTAHCLALGFGAPQAGRWLRAAAPALIFLVLFGFGLVQVDDYSPLLLLTVWAAAMTLAWSLAARHWGTAGSILLAGALVTGAVVLLREHGPGSLPSAGFYADRFQVWLDPLTHPHTGEQVLLGARAIADGAWLGTDHLFGLTALGRDAGAVLHIPAVQDDFAPAFFLNRHGLAAALLLWLEQAAFLTGMVQLAAEAWIRSRAARGFRAAWRERFACFAIAGGGAFVLGHLLLSWGTNLAIFPVMGQPMSFLSAGGSHLLFFICPLLVFGAISAQSSEENASCPSTSNIKC